MRMLCAGIDAQIGHLLARQTVARTHPLHCLHDDALRIGAFQDLPGGARLDAARIARVPIIRLVALVAGQLDLVGIDDDHVVAHIHMRRKRCLVLAAQAHRDDRGKTAQNNALGVDQDPFLIDICRSCRECFHCREIPWLTCRARNGAAPSCDGAVINPARRRSTAIYLNKSPKFNNLQLRYYFTPRLCTPSRPSSVFKYPRGESRPRRGGGADSPPSRLSPSRAVSNR